MPSTRTVPAALLPPLALRLLVQGHGALEPSYQPVVEALALGGRIASAQPGRAIVELPDRFELLTSAWAARLAECAAWALGWGAATACWRTPAHIIGLCGVVVGPRGGFRVVECSWASTDGTGLRAPNLPSLPVRAATLPRFFDVFAAMDDAGLLKRRMEQTP